MHHQEGSVVRADVSQRRRVPTPVRVFLDRAPHQPALGRSRRIVIDPAGEIVHPEKVGRATKIDHRRHPAVQFRVLAQRALQLFHPTGYAQHCHQVATGRVAVDSDPFGIHPESARIGFQPANRRLAVVNLCGPPRLAANWPARLVCRRQCTSARTLGTGRASTSCRTSTCSRSTGSCRWT